MDQTNSFIVSGVTAAGVILAFWIILRARRKHAGGSGSVNKLAAALRDEKLKSGIIVNAIADGVILFDDQMVIRSFNPGAATLTGWQDSEAMNLDVATVVKLVTKKGEPFSEADNPLKQVFKAKQAATVCDAELITQSGKHLSLNMRIAPLTDASQKVYAAVMTFRDVTTEKAEESQRAEFISTASHEMRTPVAAIEGYLSLALNEKVATIDSRARNYLEKAHLSTQHLGRLFQDLLTSAKAEDGRLTSHPAVVEIGSFLNQIASDLRLVAEQKGLSMEFANGNTTQINAQVSDSKVIQPLFYALVDADRMREVVTNLFDNAIKYTDSGKITIGLTGNNQVVQFYVRDTGPGIPAEDLPHLFQKFYRVDNSATRTIGGTGLGLFICRKIVELYQGRIWTESQLGQGSTFYINLPRLSTQQATEQQASQAQSATLPTITSLAAS